jgi:hypothetical protein
MRQPHFRPASFGVEKELIDEDDWLAHSMSMTGLVQNRRHPRRTDVAILKSPPRPPKNEMLQVRVEEQIKTKLHKYAEFINSSELYVVSEALKAAVEERS